MKVSFHADKRAKTLEERGLDFADTPKVFAGPKLTIEDDRRDYGEIRRQTIGYLNGEMVMVVWTPRADVTHVMSMRKCNEREQAKFEGRMG